MAFMAETMVAMTLLHRRDSPYMFTQLLSSTNFLVVFRQEEHRDEVLPSPSTPPPAGAGQDGDEGG